MEKQEFTSLLTHPEHLSSVQTATIGEVVSRYPYFQPARALYLKGLKTTESFKYNQELKVTAAYTTDRSILFDFITSELFNQHEISKLIKQNTEVLKSIEVKEVDDLSVNKDVVLDDDLNRHLSTSKAVFDPELFEKKTSDYPQKGTTATGIIDIDVKNIAPTPEEQLQLGKPLDFNKDEARSFSEWLKITSFKPIKRAGEISGTAKHDVPLEKKDKTPQLKAPLDKKLDLIDKFILSNPKIPPIKEYAPSRNTDKPKLVQNDSLMTETLARIYLEQKNYEKAIQSYKILILKYPEKSSFFADQIKAVKQLQENNTK